MLRGCCFSQEKEEKQPQKRERRKTEKLQRMCETAQLKCRHKTGGGESRAEAQVPYVSASDQMSSPAEQKQNHRQNGEEQVVLTDAEQHHDVGAEEEPKYQKKVQRKKPAIKNILCPQPLDESQKKGKTPDLYAGNTDRQGGYNGDLHLICDKQHPTQRCECHICAEQVGQLVQTTALGWGRRHAGAILSRR